MWPNVFDLNYRFINGSLGFSPGLIYIYIYIYISFIMSDAKVLKPRSLM